MCRVEKNNEQNKAAPDRARPRPVLQLIGATLGIAVLLALGMLPFASLGELLREHDERQLRGYRDQ